MMRFGSTTIPLSGWLVDQGNVAREQEKRFDAISRIVNRYGLEAVELTLDFSMLYPKVFTQTFYEAAAGLQQELGFACTLHLPFLWIDPCSMNETMRRASVEAICKGIEMSAPLEVESCVLHLWGNMTQLILSVLEEPERMIGMVHQQAGRSLEALGECIPLEKLCVETLEKPSFEMFRDVLEVYPVRICLDVGHLFWQGGEYADFLGRYQDRIQEVHLHDARRAAGDGTSPSGEAAVHDHLPLGEGEIDLRGFLAALEKRAYQGTVIIENNTRPDFEKSMRWLEKWKQS